MGDLLNFDVDLFDIKSVNKLEESLSRFPSQTEIAMANTLIELAEVGNDYLVDKLSEHGLANSKLANSFRIELYNDGIAFVLDSEYAMYVEFGTGYEGELSPHPNTEFERLGRAWEYDVNDHGEKGWWYPTTQNDPNPTKKRLKSGDWIAWTRGQKSHPFMYETWLYLRRIMYSKLRKHMRRMDL